MVVFACSIKLLKELREGNGCDEMKITEGDRVVTRYFGGYEAVIIHQVHESYFVVARFGGAAKNLDGGEGTSILPRDQVEKVTRQPQSA